MAVEAVKISGLAELQRGFNRLSKELGKELQDELKKLGDPVREEAERLADGEGWGAKWSKMRVGYSRRIVYVAPGARRRGGSPRPNFGGLLMRKALIPALDSKQAEIQAGVAGMLDGLLDEF